MVRNDTPSGNFVGQCVHDQFFFLFFLLFNRWTIDSHLIYGLLVEYFLLDFLIIGRHICEIYLIDKVAILFKDVESVITLDKDFTIIEESWHIYRILKVIEESIFAGIGFLIEFHLVMVWSTILIDVEILFWIAYWEWTISERLCHSVSIFIEQGICMVILLT